MCGRYVSPETAEIERAWELRRRSPNLFPRRYNVAPTLPVQVIRTARDSPAWELTEARWGFIPAWWKQPKPPGKSFNARVEDAAAKPMWRDAYARMRCLVPAVGWYEWNAVESADRETGEIAVRRQPHYLHRPDGKLACFAGLLSYRKEEGKEGFLTCAILTREASASVSEVHHRMPVVLQDTELGHWLDRSLVRPEAVAAMIDGAQGAFVHHPVTPRLNAAKTDEPDFIAPLIE
jgi:putative SOS response-associated peptidase YedK